MSTHTEALPTTHTNHGGVALVLALLGIPGTTLAWDLPLGGLWIGLPLAVAAIVLGRRSRGGAATAAVALGAVEIALMAVWTIVSLVS